MRATPAITSLVASGRITALASDKRRSYFESLNGMVPPAILVSWEQTGAPVSPSNLVGHTLGIDLAMESEAKSLQLMTAIMNMSIDQAPWWRKPQQVHANITSIAIPTAQRRDIAKSETSSVDYTHITIILDERC